MTLRRTIRRAPRPAKTVSVFAYGSNLDEDQMGRRCPESYPTFTAVLPGYRLAFAGLSSGWGGGVATVVADPTSEVQGMIYEVTLADLAKLDRYEGHPTVYRRGSMGVILDADGSERIVQVYRRNAFPQNSPSDDYLETIQCAYDRLGFDGKALGEAAADRSDASPRRVGTKTLVFVYGSLLRGLPNHAVLAKNGSARFVRHDISEPVYTMVSLGSFPAVHRGGSTSILGEVWEVDAECLAALDRLEGHPNFYHRAAIDLGGSDDVVSYFLTGRARVEQQRVTSGDWRHFWSRERWQRKVYGP